MCIRVLRDLWCVGWCCEAVVVSTAVWGECGGEADWPSGGILLLLSVCRLDPPSLLGHIPNPFRGSVGWSGLSAVAKSVSLSLLLALWPELPHLMGLYWYIQDAAAPIRGCAERVK